MKYSFRAMLFETQTLLAETGEERWSGALRELLDRYDQSPSGVRRDLLSLYAHKNSFSDFTLSPGERTTAETSRRFDRLQAELYRACVDEENAAQGVAGEEAFDFPRLAIEVAVVAVPLFLVRIANPINTSVSAGALEYLSMAIMAIAWSIGICAAYRVLRTLLRGDVPEGSGQYVTLGFGAQIACALLFDSFLAIWIRLGAGIPAFDSFETAIGCAGLIWPAAAMMYGARQASVEAPWRHALLAGAILFATFLLPAVLYSLQWMTRIAVGNVDALDGLAFLGYALATFVCGLGGLAWLAYLLGIYARERSNGERYPWMHYAPLVMWSLSLLSIAVLAIEHVAFA
jgi:hypothetical protein